MASSQFTSYLVHLLLIYYLFKALLVQHGLIWKTVCGYSFRIVSFCGAGLSSLCLHYCQYLLTPLPYSRLCHLWCLMNIGSTLIIFLKYFLLCHSLDQESTEVPYAYHLIQVSPINILQSLLQPTVSYSGLHTSCSCLEHAVDSPDPFFLS